eukprot:scpid58204/ scgid17051/ 
MRTKLHSAHNAVQVQPDTGKWKLSVRQMLLHSPVVAAGSACTESVVSASKFLCYMYQALRGFGRSAFVLVLCSEKCRTRLVHFRSFVHCMHQVHSAQVSWHDVCTDCV